MKLIRFLPSILWASLLGLGACSRHGTSSEAATDRWLGRWNGPEGTFLRLDGGSGKYEVTIQNLDGPQTYQGVSAGGQIQFVRHDVQESLHATNGAGTGMKWLSDKKDCLTVRQGEGFCRD